MFWYILFSGSSGLGNLTLSDTLIVASTAMKKAMNANGVGRPIHNAIISIFNLRLHSSGVSTRWVQILGLTGVSALDMVSDVGSGQ